MMQLARRVANRSLDALFVPGAEGLWSRRLRGRVMVLVYHRVAPPDEFPFLAEGGSPTISPGELERDIEFLAGQGARFLTFADLHAGRFPGPREIGVAVTFDDGFRDAYERGLAILERQGARGTVFQATAMLDRCELLLEHRLYRRLGTESGCASLIALAERLGPESVRPRDARAALTVLLEQVPMELLREHLDAGGDDPEDLRNLARRLYPDAAVLRSARNAGHDIGSHGHGHHHRATLDHATFEDELRRSRDELAKVLGSEPISFSYPFNAREPGDRERCGRYFGQVATVDKELVAPGFDPLAIPRFTWPGPARNALRHRRWLLTGRI